VRIRRPAPARRAAAGEAPVLAGITLQLLDEEAPDPARRAAVLDSAGLAPGALDDPNATIPHDAMCLIWSELTDEHPDLTFGVRFADRVGMRALGVAGYLAASSATAADAIQRVVAYHRLLKSAGDVALQIEDDWLRVIEVPPPGAWRWPRHLAEAILACYPSVAGRLAGATVPTHEVRVQHPDPGSAARAEAERAFGCAIGFGARQRDRAAARRPGHRGTHQGSAAERAPGATGRPDARRTARARRTAGRGADRDRRGLALGRGEPADGGPQARLR
jgi:hypothetical protein